MCEVFAVVVGEGAEVAGQLEVEGFVGDCFVGKGGYHLGCDCLLAAQFFGDVGHGGVRRDDGLYAFVAVGVEDVVHVGVLDTARDVGLHVTLIGDEVGEVLFGVPLFRRGAIVGLG